MAEYIVSKVYPSDKKGHQQIDELLHAEGIRRDGNLDYTCAVYDEDFNVIATGSCYANTLRCLAVSSSHQGEGLMNTIVSHLMEIQCDRGNTHVFLYTKCDSAKFFGDLGFYEIVRIEDRLVFMENRKTGFSQYLDQLKVDTGKLSAQEGVVSGLVMNANPFTLGHLYLLEKAAAESDVLHLFIVSEDASLIPFSVRKKLIIEGTKHLNNICYHDTGPYIVSNSTFPSYFQKDGTDIITGHAMLDLTIFLKIAKALGINRRYVGEEPNSQVTGIYNDIMQQELPKAGVQCIVIPRKESGGAPISASTVRKAIKDNHMELLKTLVPQTTLDYFLSSEAEEVIENIRAAENVIHY
ncbi:[citrate (pro-3S)-lyase] ligase [Lacrimispora sp.]|uniref:[citrate (pro-3S)-lyase] ligase n=1 Tax=Lacrimispora sp. TaxID=2719234 RepID=UPI002FD8A5DB